MQDTEKSIYIGIAFCFLVLMVGVSFAYFVASTTASGSGNKVSATTAELATVTYDAGSSTLSLLNAIPGDSASKTFSVTVSPTDDEPSVSYAIKFNITTNTFVACSASNYDETSNPCTIGASELVYTLKSGDTTIATGDLLGTTGEITLATESNKTSSITYTLVIEFKETDAAQNHNENQSFVGDIEVELVS